MNETISNLTYEDERSLFGSTDLTIENCTFAKGESPLKECKDLRITQSSFQYKYPLWYSTNVEVTDSFFAAMSRAGIWYTDHVTMKGCTFDAPKCFRRGRDILLENVHLKDAAETLWNCEDVTLNAVRAKGSHFAMNSRNLQLTDCEIEGDYFLMGCSDITVKGLVLNGNYCFDSCRNVIIEDSFLNSKDCIWNCENVTIKNTTIRGEYLAWNSGNVTLIDCTIESLQGLCYIKGLTLENCRLKGTSLAFEYSEVTAVITDSVESVINPKCGHIVVPRIDKLIMDPNEVNVNATVIEAEIGERLEHFDGIIP